MSAVPSGLIVVDVSALAPDAGVVDALARLQLAARRRGLETRLLGAAVELLELIAFVGLAEVLCVEPGRQPEEREQRLGVEEERELGDPAAL
jgi:hypothetical protein